MPGEDSNTAQGGAALDDTLVRIAGTLDTLASDMRRSADTNVAYRDVAARRAIRITELVKEVEDLKRAARRDADELRTARTEVARLRAKAGVLAGRVTRLRGRLEAERRAAAALRQRRLVRWAIRIDSGLRRLARRLLRR